MSYATRPFAIAAVRQWPLWAVLAGCVAAGAALACVLLALVSAFRWVEYNQLRARAGALYCADVPDGVEQLGTCGDFACLERKTAALDAGSEALIKYAVRCERVLDRQRE